MTHAPKQRENGEGTIFQRSSDNMWVARIPIGYNKNGTIKQVQKTATTLEKLKEKIGKYSEIQESMQLSVKTKNVIKGLKKLVDSVDGNSNNVILRYNRNTRQTHMINKDGYTYCNQYTEYDHSNMYWNDPYGGSPKGCTCNSCKRSFINSKEDGYKLLLEIEEKEMEAMRHTADIMSQMYKNVKEKKEMSIERKPEEEKARFEKLRETADLLEAGYEEFINNLNSPEVKAIEVITKVKLEFNQEYLEILKDLPSTIRTFSNELEEAERIGAYANFTNDIYKIIKQYKKVLKQEI